MPVELLVAALASIGDLTLLPQESLSMQGEGARGGGEIWHVGDECFACVYVSYQ